MPNKNILDYIPGCRFAIGVCYVLLLMVVRQQVIKKGKIVEYPDELGLWWEENKPNE